MTFAPLRRVETAWRTWSGDGIQRIALWRDDERIVGEGTAVVAGAGGYGAVFRVECDVHWRVRAADIDVVGGASLRLRSSGAGSWSGAQGRALPALDGCIDIDLQASPLTNTLPIRRHTFGTGERRSFDMVYVPFPSLDPFVDGQIYTCLEPDRLYRYEAADGTFTADIPVDADGVVLDYPTLFRRLA